MELSVLERIILLGVLPAESDFLTLKIIRKLKEDLSFSEAEHKELVFKNAGEKYKSESGVEMVVPEGQVHWNPKTTQVKDFQFGEKAKSVIVGALEKLNREKKLTNNHFSLYEKFIGMGD